MSSYYDYMSSVKPVKLKLGYDYLAWTNPNRLITVRLIMPTKKGYNLLNIAKSKCVFKHHVYPLKYDEFTKDNETWFHVPKHLFFKELKECLKI